MVPKLILIFPHLYFISNLAYCQPDMGARTVSMGNTSATAIGPWSMNANPAGMSTVSRPILALGYTSIMNLTELRTQAAVLVVPVHQNQFGLSVERQSFTAFSNLTAGIGYGKKLGDNFNVAIRLNYHQVFSDDYGYITGFSIDFGSWYIMNETIIIGAYISNPSRQRYPLEIFNNLIPSNYNIGLSWRPSDRLLMETTLVKEQLLSPDFRIGLEYSPIPMFSLRGGISLKPLRHYAGLGFIRKTLDIAVAITSDHYQSYRPQISVGYEW